MNNLYLVIIIAVCILGTVYFLKRVHSNKKKAAHIYTQDANAQALYTQKKQHTRGDENITKEQMVELSWQFLYDITEFVLNKFTEADKQEVSKLGERLAKADMRYQHIVELSIKPKHSIASEQTGVELNR